MIKNNVGTAKSEHFSDSFFLHRSNILFFEYFFISSNLRPQWNSLLSMGGLLCAKTIIVSPRFKMIIGLKWWMKCLSLCLEEDQLQVQWKSLLLSLLLNGHSSLQRCSVQRTQCLGQVPLKMCEVIFKRYNSIVDLSWSSGQSRFSIPLRLCSEYVIQLESNQKRLIDSQWPRIASRLHWTLSFSFRSVFSSHLTRRSLVKAMRIRERTCQGEV